MTWDTVIGLEVHAQLKTKSKLFSGTATRFGAPPNSLTSYIDAGLPGVLPVLNQEAVMMAIQFGLSIGAEINDYSYFERKNYVYPDLPKGYQISQFQRPIVSHGFLSIPLDPHTFKKVDIVRAHLEEDAGKSSHDSHPNYSGIDLNRAGTPLLEIVTSPCLFSAQEVLLYLKALQQLLRFLDICDGNMQEGSFRCDVNLSIKPAGSTTLGTRTELKNLNSFRFIEKAIHYETNRHREILEQGGSLQQETRLFCTNTETTLLMRSKEQEQDYRYFPDPDLLPIAIDASLIDTIRKNLPPLPQDIRLELEAKGSLTEEEINFLLATPATWQFYKAVTEKTAADEKIVCNWLKGHYAAALKDKNLGFEDALIAAETFALLLTHLHNNTINNSAARQIFKKLLEGDTDIDALLLQEQQNTGVDEVKLTAFIQALIKQYPGQAEEYRQGKEKLLAFFVGQVMKETKGQAAPEVVNELVKKALLS